MPETPEATPWLERPLVSALWLVVKLLVIAALMNPERSFFLYQNF